jgi:hypothetical protein
MGEWVLKKVMILLAVVLVGWGSVAYGEEAIDNIENFTNCVQVLTPGEHTNLSIFVNDDGQLICQDGVDSNGNDN